jgi:hypothetical protein
MCLDFQSHLHRRHQNHLNLQMLNMNSFRHHHRQRELPHFL